MWYDRWNSYRHKYPIAWFSCLLLLLIINWKYGIKFITFHARFISPDQCVSNYSVNGSWNRLFLDRYHVIVLSRFNDSKDEDDVAISTSSLSRFTIQIERLWIVSNGWMGLFLLFWGILKIVTIAFFFHGTFYLPYFPFFILFVFY